MPTRRKTPAEQLHTQVDEVFASGGDLAGAIGQIARLGAQLLLQSALEAEVTAFLGRERYERATSRDDTRKGMRNGYCPVTVKTTAGPVTLQRPKLRGTTERFASRLFGSGVTKTNALEALVIAGFVRGLSTRDIEGTLAETLGDHAAISRSTVSRVCQEIKTQFDAWCAHRLDEGERPTPRRGPTQPSRRQETQRRPICLARRRRDVLYAMLRDNALYRRPTTSQNQQLPYAP